MLCAISQIHQAVANLHRLDTRPEGMDITGIGIILVTRKAKDRLLRDAFFQLRPIRGGLIDGLDRLQGAGNGATTAPSHDKDRLGRFLHQHLLNQF